MSLIKLIRIVNLENWLLENGSVAQYPKTSIEEYEEAVENLINKINERENIDNAKDALKKMYTVFVYYQAPVLMSKREFYKIIDEFADGEFLHLEKFKLFLITAAKIYHLKEMEEDYNNLIYWYNKIGKTKHDQPALEVLNILQRRRIEPNFEFDRSCKNLTEINKEVVRCRQICRTVEEEYLALLANMPFIPIKEVKILDFKY